MELNQFLFYLGYRDCVEIDRRRIHFVYRGPEGPVVNVPRNVGHLERETIYLLCMDLGIDMPEHFKDYQAKMNQVWPTRKFRKQ